LAGGSWQVAGPGWGRLMGCPFLLCWFGVAGGIKRVRSGESRRRSVARRGAVLQCTPPAACGVGGRRRPRAFHPIREDSLSVIVELDLANRVGKAARIGHRPVSDRGILRDIAILQQQSLGIAPTPRLSLTGLQSRHSMFGTGWMRFVLPGGSRGEMDYPCCSSTSARSIPFDR
jgi:hypothetical protein